MSDETEFMSGLKGFTIGIGMSAVFAVAAGYGYNEILKSDMDMLEQTLASLGGCAAIGVSVCLGGFGLSRIWTKHTQSAASGAASGIGMCSIAAGCALTAYALS